MLENKRGHCYDNFNDVDASSMKRRYPPAQIERGEPRHICFSTDFVKILYDDLMSTENKTK